MVFVKRWGGVGGCTACSGVMLLDKLDPRGRKHGGLTPSIRREEPRWSYRKKKKVKNKLLSAFLYM